MEPDIKKFCIFISTSWNRGAISQQFRAIAQELAHRGHRVILIIDHQKKQNTMTATNPAVYTWNSYRPTGFRDAWFLQKLIWKFHPDCLISQFGSENIFLLLGFLNRIPCRITWYHSILEEPKEILFINRLFRKFFIWRKRLILNLASNVVSVSDAAGVDAEKVFQVSRKKIVTIYNSIKDPSSSFLSETKPDRNYVSCVSALTDAKGQETLIRAIPLICDKYPSIVVEFIGSGEMAQRYQELAKSLKVERNCIFSGTVSYEQVLEKMRGSWVTIFPTRSEAFGLVVIESLAVGTPVIASKTGGVPEIIQDGVEGFLFPVDDHNELAKKLLQLLSDENLRLEMAQNARKKFLAKFNLEKRSKLHATKIEDLIGGHIVK